MTTSVSPSYSDSKLNSPSVDDIIDVYEDRVRNWLLRPAKAVLTEARSVLHSPHIFRRGLELTNILSIRIGIHNNKC